MDDPRTIEQRRADTVARLTSRNGDAWVATAGEAGAHLVPLSYAWDGTHILLATERASVTTRNLRSAGRARLALGHSRDVVMVEAALTEEISVRDAPATLADRYAAQTDWDPRGAKGDMVYVLLRPTRIQAWRESNEIAGRTLMSGGDWLA